MSSSWIPLALALVVPSEAPRASAPPLPDPWTLALGAAIDGDQAYADTRAVFEAGWRDRGNLAYHAALSHLRDRLLESGFEEDALDDVRERTLGPERPTWDGRRATLELLHADGAAERLVGFEGPSDPDRTCLCRFSAATAADGEEFDVVVDPARGDDVRGKVVFASRGAAALHSRFVLRGGARGVLADTHADYNRPDLDPGVIGFGSLPQEPGGSAFGFQLSPGAAARLREAAQAGPVRVRVTVDAAFGPAAAMPLLLATVGGTRADLAPVWVSAHLDEPGANDNASGCATAVAAAAALRRVFTRGDVPRPARAVVFLIGQEIEGPRRLLEARGEASGALGPPLVGISLDMTGEDPESNGAPFLIERLPDPSALRLRPPDAHTEWGAGRVAESWVRGHLLGPTLRASALAVAAREPGFAPRTHPFEGGSDHQPMLDRGVPAALLWHFTDWTYHTNRDTMEQVSADELRRSAWVTAIAARSLADASVSALEGNLALVLDDASERFAHEADNARARPDDPDLAWAIDAWEAWYLEAVDSCVAVVAADEGVAPPPRPEVDAARTRVAAMASEVRAITR